MDLILLPAISPAGEDPALTPGLHIATPPRRPARSRHADRLLLYLTISGDYPVTPSEQEQLLARMAHIYYKTAGSVTNALRATANALNKHLLERNLRDSKQNIAIISMLTLREKRLYIAHCGPAHGYLISSQEVTQLYHPESAGYRLGFGQTIPIHYFQAELSAGDILIFTNQETLSWNPEALKGLFDQGLSVIYRRLREKHSQHSEFLLLQAQPGTGNIHLTRPEAVQHGDESLEKKAVKILRTAMPKPPAYSELEQAPDKELPQPQTPVMPEPAPPYEPVVPSGVNLPEDAPTARTIPATIEQEQAAQIPDSQPQEAAPRRKTTRKAFSLAPIFKVFLTVGRAFSSFFGQVGQTTRSFIGRLLPGEGIFTIPSSVMFFTAVAVPLVVVAIATVIYFQLGRAGQYDTYIAQAHQAAGYARTLEDPQERVQAYMHGR